MKDETRNKIENLKEKGLVGYVDTLASSTPKVSTMYFGPITKREKGYFGEQTYLFERKKTHIREQYDHPTKFAVSWKSLKDSSGEHEVHVVNYGVDNPDGFREQDYRLKKSVVEFDHTAESINEFCRSELNKIREAQVELFGKIGYYVRDSESIFGERKWKI
jgi:hypothetical protein